MQRPWLLLRRSIGVMSIVLILLALVIWTIRPSPFSEWLGAEGQANFITPLSIIRIWANGRLAPMTPTGFITLFPIFDLLILGALLAALCILLVLFPTLWRNQRTASWLTRSIPLFRLPRVGMRVRTTMILIAIICLDLGWEIVTWKNWQLREQYRARAAMHGQQEDRSWQSLHDAETRLARLDAETSARPEDTETPAARAAERAFTRDRLQQESAYASHQAAYFAELRRKYEHAAADPSRPVLPDPPPPNEHRPLREGIFMLQGNYAQALADCDELIRRYSDLPWPHRERAWILATCPDSKFRNGKLAVAAASRAAELTNWKAPDALRALAAAYAEAGDFASAVRWQQRGMELEQAFLKRFPPPGGTMAAPSVVEDPLALYKAGKPFRTDR